ncbi:MAG: ABC transporter ATP-binding protein [Thiohalomonadales bacterium]
MNNMLNDLALNKNAKVKDINIINKYTTQPGRLPDAVRDFLKPQIHGETIEVYAYVDLDAKMMLNDAWLVVSRTYVSLVKNNPVKKYLSIVFLTKRSCITAIKERTGLSCISLKFDGDSAMSPLPIIRYSYRQRLAVSNIIFILQQSLENIDVQIDNADTEYGKAIAQPIRKAQALFVANRLSVVWRLMSYLAPYRTQLGIGIISAVVVTLMSLIVPFLTMKIIDDIYNPFIQGVISRDEALSSGSVIIVILIGVFVVREFCHWLRLRTMSVLGEYVARDIRTELYAHIQKLSLSYFTKKQTGSLISRVSNDTDRLWDFLAFGIVEVTLAAMMIIGLSIVLLLLDWRLGLVVIIPIPFLLWSFVLHSRTLNRIFTKAWRTWSRITEILSDTIPGIRVVKAFNQENAEVNKFNKQNEITTNQFNEVHRNWTKFWPRILFVLHLTLVAVWWFAIPRLFDDGSTNVTPLSFGTFLAFLLYMGMYFQPMEAIGMLMRMINRATSSAHRVFEVMDTEPEIKNCDSPIKLSPLKGQVEFKNVSFAYDGIRKVLKDISFKVEPGEMIGLVGSSGAGKSTITNLIAQFYEHNTGSILIDGVEINKLDIGAYRQQIGMVLQDPYLFHGTILDNIRYADKAKPLAEVIDAARAANAHDFICKLPHGYETIVGERGLTLSGGERQRISIARAITIDPKILILDEATSSVDSETEKNIQDALDHLIEGRTVFAIAHRLSTLRKADRIFVLQDGKLVEQGSHAELLAKDMGIYRRLTTLQHEMHEMYAV